MKEKLQKYMPVAALTWTEVLMIIDALEYASTQTEESGGEIDAFNCDGNAAEEEKLIYAAHAKTVATRLKTLIDTKSKFTVVIEG